MCVTIKAKSVKRDALAALLENLKDNFAYLMVSDWREIHFVEFNQRSSVNLSVSDRGRAFGEKAELRWRRSEDENHFCCRWISDDGASLDTCWNSLPEEEMKVLKPEKSPVHYLLWGEPLWLSEGDTESAMLFWYQARIPRKLAYPIPENLAKELADERKANPKDKTPLVLSVREYKQNGQTMFERFIGLGRYKSKKED